MSGIWTKQSKMIIIHSLLTTFEAARAVAKIGLRLKPNHHNQVMLVQIPDTHLSMLWVEMVHVTKNYVNQYSTYGNYLPFLERF